MGRTPALPPSSDSTVRKGGPGNVPTVVPPPNSTSNEKANGTASKMMIDACGEIRSSSEVLDFMKSLEAQDNINVVEPAPPPPMALPGAFLVGPTNHVPEDGAIAIDVNRDHDDDNNNMYAAAAGDVPTIVAHLAPDEDEIRAMYQEQLEAEVRMRLALVTNDATILVADDDSMQLDQTSDTVDHGSFGLCGGRRSVGWSCVLGPPRRRRRGRNGRTTE